MVYFQEFFFYEVGKDPKCDFSKLVIGGSGGSNFFSHLTGA